MPDYPWIDEARFQSSIKKTPWYQQFTLEYGEPPNISPRSDYDLRKAWLFGVQPRINADTMTYHWPSVEPVFGSWLKKEGHPTRIIEEQFQSNQLSPSVQNLLKLIQSLQGSRK